MRYIKIKCVNKDCAGFNQEETVAAGRPVGTIGIELLSTIECSRCEHHMWTERV